MLFLVEMCEQDGREASDNFQMGDLKPSYVTRLIIRLILGGLGIQNLDYNPTVCHFV